MAYTTNSGQEKRDGPILQLYNRHSDDGLVNDAGVRDSGFTRHDQRDMQRMGKRQELVRIFRPLSAISFTVLIQETWECTLIANSQVLVDGGTAGFFWSYLWTFIGFGIVMMSLAEMASMSPTSGGQYHWVSEFAPPEYQEVLSYITGWLSTLSWQAGAAANTYLCAILIQSMIIANNTDYVPKLWHTTLLTIGMAIVLFFNNIWGSKAMPAVQNITLVVHIFTFFAVIFCLWFLAPLNSAEIAFTQFTNSGGWSTMGVTLMTGQLTAVYALICSDAAAHMAEEVKDASRNVPRAMVWSYVLNGGLGLVFVITMIFVITDIDAAINDPSGYPFIWVFKQAVSLPGINTLTVLVSLVNFVAAASLNTSTSRQTFAFARDGGLPKWLGNVHPRLHVPANAVATTCAITCLLSLINIGSMTAFEAFISLQVCALVFTYIISISCVLYRRIYFPHLLPHARWGLGRAGLPINILGIMYSLFIFFWCFWPQENGFSLEGFNWASVLFIATCVLCAGMYFIQGKRMYVSPVSRIGRNS